MTEIIKRGEALPRKNVEMKLCKDKCAILGVGLCHFKAVSRLRWTTLKRAQLRV